MALVHRLGQRIGDAGPHPDHGGLVDAEPHRDGIGGLKPDATDVAGQAIGILRHHLHGIAAVGLVDAHGPRRADTMAVQEDHDLADTLCLAHAAVMRPARIGPTPSTSRRRSGCFTLGSSVHSAAETS